MGGWSLSENKAGTRQGQDKGQDSGRDLGVRDQLVRGGGLLREHRLRHLKA